MFTGIIETKTAVISTSNNFLTIARPALFDEIFLGQSIAVNGACLSVVEWDDEKIGFSVLSETFRKTNLGEAKTVNVERAMPANGRFEGHIVLGHVDNTVKLLDKKQEISGTQMVFQMPTHQNLLVEKGSIAINGVSLTLANISEKSFSIYLIPLTLQHTNLGSVEIGESVNIEYDYFAKIVAKNFLS